MNEPFHVHVSAPTIAIVGSGPSGCYLASFLRKRWADAEIVIFDKLPTPYGLARFGVAPDHLGTRAVVRQFERLFSRSGVRFMGDVEIGVQVSLDELRTAFDIVVLATGLSSDRSLDVPGSSLRGIHGSGRLTRLINSHPDEQVDELHLGKDVTIVGNGNVAIDLVRLLLTPAARLSELGVPADVLDAIGAGPVRRIDVVGRSPVHRAKFDLAMVRELADVPDVRFVAEDLPAVADDSDPEGVAKQLAVRALAENSARDAARTVQFHFGWTPERVIGDATVEGIEFRQNGEEHPHSLVLEADSVITAIGFSEREDAPLRRRDYERPDSQLEHGHLASGLYCAGWLRRGPQGTIPMSRADSKLIADAIGEAVTAGELATGKPGLIALTALYSRATDPRILEVSA
ncbi:MAG: FAD-dependent oxidoreductase [Brevibacterium sp.]|uniref:FAD-dependent oxidoreductase n=1 Tax=Brachybacterium alimentarium TaxID=47845 RepID=UPI0031D93887